ncbi:MAG: alpha/beta hydrolase [Bdellovibrionaceae bacterium]|jgi:alpha-beta hydrolase superfamily lysophospholipase|nr:alpha/beta hydrolase [Pseudobdellovibrionaceae bacterium]
MTERFESHFKSFDDTELFLQAWTTKNPVGSLLICHGVCEHSEPYAELAQFLNKNHWNVYAVDLRGHGRSDGKRGYVKHFSEFEKDLHAFINVVDKEYHKAGLPLILLGHSMGGLVSLKSLISFGNQNLTALCLSAPALGISTHVPPWKHKAAEVLSDWAPKVTLHSEINYEDLSRDPEVLASYPKDALRHQKISPRLYLGMNQAFSSFPQFANAITLPLFIQIPEKDPVVDSEATQMVFEILGSKSKKIKVYKNRKHEIFNDLDKNEPQQDLLGFINHFAQPKDTK